MSTAVREATTDPDRRLTTVLAAGLTAGILATCTGAPPRTSGPPNVVLIVADDLGWADLSCQGGTIPTPHLDALARSGVRFTDGYVSQGACTPSRASILTGCYANRVGLPDVLFPGAQVGLSPDEDTIADLLRERGYATAAFGKWHLGDREPCSPLHHGFDRYLGLPYSNDMWPVDYDGNPSTDERTKARHPTLRWWDGRRQLESIDTLADQGTITGRITDAACAFVREHAHRPFFVYLAHPMPHVPIAAGAAFAGRTGQGLYADVVHEIDASVGEILATLDATGQRDNTLVVFVSDNGPWLNFGNHAGSAAHLRSGKGTTWEGGARVPFLAALPSVIPPETTCDRMVATLDLLPTIAALTGARLPARQIDGLDLTPLLRDPASPAVRDALWFYYARDLQAVRRGRFKLHLPHAYRRYEGHAPGRDGRPGPVSQGHTDLALYDLAVDPGEQRDVRREHPHLVHALLERAAAARAELGDRTTGPGCREPWRAPR